MTLSVVLPTLNCADDLPAHIRSMESWLDLAGEIIAVDSDSTDGTVDVIRGSLKHPNLNILNHPRGLYQSWNHAISQTRGRWVYISTIGDTITRAQLEHLMNAGEALDADVVSSPPEFVFDAKINMATPVWPISRILEFHQITEPAVIHPMAAFCHAFRCLPNAILGSSASNIYRGEHLRARPFPTSFRMAGDTGWALRHAMETRFCYTRRTGSVFRFHSDTYLKQDIDGARRLIASLHEEGIQLMDAHLASDRTGLLGLLRKLSLCEKQYKEARLKFRNTMRESAIPWFLRPSAIKAYRYRNALKSKPGEMLPMFEAKLKELPLFTAS